MEAGSFLEVIMQRLLRTLLLSAALSSAVTARGAVVCPGSTPVEGVDVTALDGPVVWTSVRAAGKEFAFVRASEGIAGVDAAFADNWAGAKAAGLVRGALHVFRPGQDAVAQADHFVATVGTLEDTDLPLAVDLSLTDGESATSIGAALDDFVTEVYSATHMAVFARTSASSASSWTRAVSGASSALLALWVVDHDVSCPEVPAQFTGGRWWFWQHTAAGAAGGIGGPVHLDRFNGTLAELRALGGAPRDFVAGPSGGSGCAAGSLDAAGGLALVALAAWRLRRAHPRAQPPT